MNALIVGIYTARDMNFQPPVLELDKIPKLESSSVNFKGLTHHPIVLLGHAFASVVPVRPRKSMLEHHVSI